MLPGTSRNPRIRRENATFRRPSRHKPHVTSSHSELRRGARIMQHIQQGYRSLTLLMQINWDWLLYIGTIGVALGAGAWLGTLIN